MGELDAVMISDQWLTGMPFRLNPALIHVRHCVTSRGGENGNFDGGNTGTKAASAPF